LLTNNLKRPRVLRAWPGARGSDEVESLHAGSLRQAGMMKSAPTRAGAT
jgi:hypothetical protein